MNITHYPSKDGEGRIIGPPTLFTCESESNPGQKYPVQLQLVCACPDYMYRQKGECKHTRAVHAHILEPEKK